MTGSSEINRIMGSLLVILSLVATIAFGAVEGAEGDGLGGEVILSLIVLAVAPIPLLRWIGGSTPEARAAITGAVPLAAAAALFGGELEVGLFESIGLIILSFALGVLQYGLGAPSYLLPALGAAAAAVTVEVGDTKARWLVAILGVLTAIEIVSGGIWSRAAVIHATNGSPNPGNDQWREQRAPADQRHRDPDRATAPTDGPSRPVAVPATDHQPATLSGSGRRFATPRVGNSGGGGGVVEPPEESPFLTVDAPRASRTDPQEIPPLTVGLVPSHQFDGYVHGELTVRAASHIGTGHMRQRKPRQDAYAIGLGPGESHLIVAVADGVSQAALSSIGAVTAAQHAVTIVASGLRKTGIALDGLDLAAKVSAQMSSLEQNWNNTTSRDFATTLVVATIDCRTFVTTLTRVGDSTAYVRRPEGFEPLFDDTGKTNATAALPAELPATEVTETKLGVGDCLLVTTDGLGEPLLQQPSFARLVHDRLASPPPIHQFSGLVGVQKPQAHDDQTAVAVWRHPQA